MYYNRVKTIIMPDNNIRREISLTPGVILSVDGDNIDFGSEPGSEPGSDPSGTGGYQDIIYQETIPNNSTTNIIIGNKNDVESAHIYYNMIIGVRRRSGTLYITHNNTQTSIRDEYTELNTPIPLTIGADININDFRLNITSVSAGGNVTFSYMIRKIS